MFCKMNYNLVNGVCDLVYNSESGKKPSAKSTNKRHSGCSWNITGLRKRRHNQHRVPFSTLSHWVAPQWTAFLLRQFLKWYRWNNNGWQCSEIHQEELKVGFSQSKTSNLPSKLKIKHIKGCMTAYLQLQKIMPYQNIGTDSVQISKVSIFIVY